MKARTTAAALVAALVCLHAWYGAPFARAQTMGLGAPMTVRFVGTFTPWTEGRPGGADTLGVTMGGKRFFFHVSSYDGSDPTLMLVSHISPPEIELLGPAARLGMLQQPAAGKKYAIEGWLYAGDPMFYVAAVKPLRG